jgi:hypothetical protein
MWSPDYSCIEACDCWHLLYYNSCWCHANVYRYICWKFMGYRAIVYYNPHFSSPTHDLVYCSMAMHLTLNTCTLSHEQHVQPWYPQLRPITTKWNLRVYFWGAPAWAHMCIWQFFSPCLPYTSQLPWRWIWHWRKLRWICVLWGLMPRQFLWYCIVDQHIGGYNRHIGVEELIFYELFTRTPLTMVGCHSIQNQEMRDGRLVCLVVPHIKGRRWDVPTICLFDGSTSHPIHNVLVKNCFAS